MENMYLISESELIDLLAAYHYMNCLDSQDAGTWARYLIKTKEYLKEFKSFEDKAKDELKYYTKINEV